MEFTINYNYGLSVSPVSLFINYSHNLYDFDFIYDKISKSEIRDIILFNFDKSDYKGLVWLTPRLILNGKIVSLVFKNSLETDLKAVSRIIIVDNPNVSQFFSFLRERDILIYNGGKIDELLSLRNQIITHEVKSIIMFDSKSVDGAKLIELGVFDITPFEHIELIYGG